MKNINLTQEDKREIDALLMYGEGHWNTDAKDIFSSYMEEKLQTHGADFLETVKVYVVGNISLLEQYQYTDNFIAVLDKVLQEHEFDKKDAQTFDTIWNDGHIGAYIFVVENTLLRGERFAIGAYAYLQNEKGMISAADRECFFSVMHKAVQSKVVDDVHKLETGEITSNAFEATMIDMAGGKNLRYGPVIFADICKIIYNSAMKEVLSERAKKTVRKLITNMSSLYLNYQNQSFNKVMSEGLANEHYSGRGK